MGNKINSKDFRAPMGNKVNLKKWPTHVEPVYESKKQYHKLLEARVKELSSLQHLRYASNRNAVLLIFQALDAAGKDAAVQHVRLGIKPQGCPVFSFKQPAAEELELDFLWRTTRRLPERGRIGIFNRYYYEEVLIVRVHPEILRCQGLPDELLDEKTIWRERYRSIVDLEEHLHRAGAHHAPWCVVPADDRKNARLILSRIVPDAPIELKMAYPRTTADRRRALNSIRKRLCRHRGKGEP